MSCIFRAESGQKTQVMNAISITSHFALIEPTDELRAYLRMQPLNYLPVKASEFSAGSQIIFDQMPEDSESGISWKQELSLVTDAQDVMQFNGRRMFVAFWMSDGSLRLIGSASSAPRLKITPYAGAFKLEASFISPEPIVL